MKLFKIFISTAIALTSTGIFAQNVSSVEHDVAKETTVMKVSPKKNTNAPYRMKVVEKRDFRFAFEEEDKGKIDQDRVILPAYVTKTIYIDNDRDMYYDKKMVVRYEKSYEDKYEIIPTKKGFDLKINNKTMAKDIARSGYYLTDKEDNDYFVVEEYRSI